MEEKKGLFGLMREVLFSRIGIIGLTLAAAYWGYSHYSTIRRVEYNTTKRNIAVEQGYYPDPAGLCIDTPINANGCQEVYLLHKESGHRVPIQYDFLPENTRMLEGLLQRARTNHISNDERTSLLRTTRALEAVLFEQEMEKK